MPMIEFLQPRFVGGRFEEHTIPLEFLRDLSVIEEMIFEVAKWQFLKDNPGRHRSPRGFTDCFSLGLTAVREGSAIPVIVLKVASSLFSAGEFEASEKEYLFKARESIIKAISAAEQNEDATKYMPRKLLTYFDRIGRSLQDDESVEFATPNQNAPAKLTKESRRRLIRASSKCNEPTENVAIRGKIFEANKDTMTCLIQVLNGLRVQAAMAAPHTETILEAFNGFTENVRVFIEGVGKFNESQRLQSFESITHISILDDMDVGAQLDDLKALKDGWLDGDGKAPKAPGLDWLTKAFDDHYPENLPRPYLYPTAEGGVQAEWSINANEISIDIDLESEKGDWHLLNLSTQAQEAQPLDLSASESWAWIAIQIKKAEGAPA